MKEHYKMTGTKIGVSCFWSDIKLLPVEWLTNLLGGGSTKNGINLCDLFECWRTAEDGKGNETWWGKEGGSGARKQRERGREENFISKTSLKNTS